MSTNNESVLREPRTADAASLFRIVEGSGVLDRNSCYAYLLLCRDFGDTCVVAEGREGLAGFVTAYRPPRRPDILFVWQVGVTSDARRRGLARRMLLHLLSARACQGVRFLEATITPSNTASRCLFEQLADHLGVPFQWVDGFRSRDFATRADQEQEHEDEPVIRIGPLPGMDCRGTATV